MFLSVSEVPLLLVFTEHHQMSRIKTVRQFKSKIWEMKGGKYAKSLAKIQGSAIFQKQDIWIIHLPKFIELCLETPCWTPIRMGTNMAAGKQQKQLLLSFPTKA